MGKMMFTVPEAASLLGVSKDIAYELIKAGLLVPLKFKSYRIAAAELDRFIKKWNGWDLSDPYNPVQLELGGEAV